jgi:hypothetical protein
MGTQIDLLPPRALGPTMQCTPQVIQARSAIADARKNSDAPLPDAETMLYDKQDESDSPPSVGNGTPTLVPSSASLQSARTLRLLLAEIRDKISLNQKRKHADRYKHGNHRRVVYKQLHYTSPITTQHGVITCSGGR